MKNLICILFSLSLLLGACNKDKAIGSLPRSIPEKEGVSSEGILKFVEALEQSSGDEFHSFILLRHGKVIAEGWWDPFKPELKQTIYSTSKTFTSTAIGFAVAENLLTVDDKVVSFFPDLLPDTVCPYLEQMTVKNLLSMATGQEYESSRKVDNWEQAFLATPVKYEPGTVFSYNSMATYMLSAIIQKLTGQRVLDYLTPRLFEPLAIEGAEWELSPTGVNTGGWGLRIHTEDMAKLGQLYLQKGQWNGKQILPASWIAEATSAKILQKPEISDEQRSIDDWAQGYCYQIWRCRNNAFRADGAYGQYIIVMPDWDAVIAIQANVGNMQREINYVWDILLPAMHPEALPENKVAAETLKQKLASLKIAPLAATTTIPASAEGTYTITDFGGQTSTFALNFDNDTCIVNWGEYNLKFGNGTWIAGETERPAPNLLPSVWAFREFPPFNVFGSYSISDSATVLLALKYAETPHTEYAECHFTGDSLHLKTRVGNLGNEWTFAGVKRQ
ncbi:MAG: beta-lactamase family protein [Dysgonamonadaceae bacterium]|jgi:CubicO group peptidase (beta-lactamase class C family)|nr:beta-lactamase family protein [Dysgonamonadaceae bacterium]